jgi:hypothetical protein
MMSVVLPFLSMHRRNESVSSTLGTTKSGNIVLGSCAKYKKKILFDRHDIYLSGDKNSNLNSTARN